MLQEKLGAENVRAASAPGRPLAALTALRFFAALYVLQLHYGRSAAIAALKPPGFVVNFLTNGYLGVSFFFVLSGFILTHVYRGRLDGGYRTTATKTYAIARFARLYPVYLLALLLTIPVTPFALSIDRLPQFVLLQSWVPPGLTGSYRLPNDNGTGWTLSVELLFYLSFPALLAWCERLTTKHVAAWIGALFALMLLFRLPLAGANGQAGPCLWLTYMPVPLLRMPEFVYGVLLGILYERQAIPVRPWMLAVVIALSLGVLGWSTEPWVASAATILFGLAIALIAGNVHVTWLAPVLGNRVLVLLGGASYAIYLLQYPVYAWLHALLGSDFELVAKAIQIPAVIAVSILVFLYYEGPARAWIRRSIDSRRGPEAVSPRARH